MAAWACSQCTFENPPTSTFCEVCGNSASSTGEGGGAGYNQAPAALAASSAPSAPPAPQEPLVVYDANELARCAWLASEALRSEARAAELEGAGHTAEALFHHRKAAAKLSEAAAACPDQHPDKPKLDEHATDIQLRMVYLESLGTAPPSLPLDEHVGELELSMDLSCAEAPVVDDVAGLVARSGASGSTSTLTEDGYKLVAALKSSDEMRIFVGRLLQAEGRHVLADGEAELEGCLKQVQSLAGLQETLQRAPGVELVLDPKKDKLELAMDLEKEARRFESLGMNDRAVDMYNRSSAILGFVIKRDPRMENAKIKQMVEGRNEALQLKAAQLTMQK